MHARARMFHRKRARNSRFKREREAQIEVARGKYRCLKNLFHSEKNCGSPVDDAVRCILRSAPFAPGNSLDLASRGFREIFDFM